MEKIQDVLNHASDKGRAVTAEISDLSSSAQQSSNNTKTQEHPTVHSNSERKDKEAALAGPSMRQNPDVMKLVATPLKGQERDIDAQIQEAVEKKLQHAIPKIVEMVKQQLAMAGMKRNADYSSGEGVRMLVAKGPQQPAPESQALLPLPTPPVTVTATPILPHTMCWRQPTHVNHHYHYSTGYSRRRGCRGKGKRKGKGIVTKKEKKD